MKPYSPGDSYSSQCRQDGLEGSSAGKVLAMQARGEDLDSEPQHRIKARSTDSTYHPSAKEKTDGPLTLLDNQYSRISKLQKETLF